MCTYQAVWGEELTRPQADAVVRDYLHRNGLSRFVRVRWYGGEGLKQRGRKARASREGGKELERERGKEGGREGGREGQC